MIKQKLTLLIKAMFLCLLFGFAYVLLRSTGGPNTVTNTNTVFDDISTGQTAARRINSERVWVTRLSNAHRVQAQELDQHVLDPSLGCQPADDLCVLKSSTDRNGIHITFTTTAPAQLSADVPWFGGFIDPTTGEVFDRLGRAYATGNISTQKNSKNNRLELPRIEEF